MSIRLDHVSAGYGGPPVLRNLSLTLPERGIVAVLGPSGRGKTTFLRLLAGLLQPSGGSITGLSDKRISMVFQEDRLLPWCTAFENVAAAADAEAAEYWLAQMELAAEAGKYPGELSGGMQRRVAIARACAFRGDILLLDEPFKGLDEALAERVMERVFAAAPLTVLVTHDAELAGKLRAETVVL